LTASGEFTDTKGVLTGPPTGRGAANWAGFFDSVEEVDLPAESVEGTLPAGLVGTLYRNGPGKRDFSQSFFDGDGMIRALRIQADGSVHCRSRFVETKKYRKERGSDRPRVRTPGTDLPGGFLRNILRTPGHEANTHIIEHHGQLLALEEGGHPYVIDRDTLATGGMLDFDGQLKSYQPYSAHPHTDPKSGEIFNFGVDFASPKVGIRSYRADRQGRVHAIDRFALPYGSFVHDYALTERFMIFHVPPLVASVLRFALGLDSFFATLQWRDDLTARFIVAPRAGGPVREFDAPSVLIGHYFGAHERGDELVIDCGQLGGWPVAAEDTASYRTSDWTSFGAAGAHRVRLDLRSGRVSSEPLSSLPAEFPRIHPDTETLDGRFGYAGCNVAPGEGGILRGVAKIDRHGGGEEIFDFGENKVSLEPVFVPDPGASSSPADEDRGWVLCLVYDSRPRKSEVAILDARCLADGPVATIRLPYNAGATFHGSFVAEG